MKEYDLLVEAAASASRDRDPSGRVSSHPAWSDLDAAGRIEAFEAARTLRVIEAALDRRSLSTTARAVLARIARARG